ncbi:MAG: single-stranded-DNA-specific exonuclease RecJ [Betaproteobacteria bacterium]|nr:single-stranded-DNA-specific exonuclease RecJ [Betaproteobacteria bacterium]
MSQIVTREVDAAAVAQLVAGGLTPFMARIYAARGIIRTEQLTPDLSRLIPPAQLLHVNTMAALLADAIAEGKNLLIVADYDADGATACAVGLRALRGFGAQVDYLVPNRFEYGYGLTPEIVQLAAAQKKPDVLITVDNGIASIEGVAEANRLGMRVLVTDHHLPGDRLPDAWCIINPNQPGCTFPSKSLAGVGVMFYLMLALRAEMRTRGAFAGQPEPNLGALLDLVALGTVADVVRLDDNNRLLVQHGLQRIRAGRAQPGINALLNAAGRDCRRASTYDLGFVAGPRLNAAGRLTDMSLGIECLITDDAARAAEIARELDQLNRQRRNIEADMQESALATIEDVTPGYTLSLFNAEWHQGVIGILASRLRERFHRPTFAFAAAGNGELKGSGRSISALHLRDALDLVSKRHPRLILRFGGHAAAAGLTLRADAFDEFRDAFEAVTRELLTPADLEREWITDGSLSPKELTLENAVSLDNAVWGQGFAEPRFHDRFEVAAQRIVGERHLKLQLRREASPLEGHCKSSPPGGRRGTQAVEAMLFGHADPLPDEITATYRLGANHYNGSTTLQLILEHWQPAD